MAVPVITSVTPSSGPAAGGTTLHAIGTGFTGTTGATLGGTAVTSFTVVDDTHLTVVAEVHAAGLVNLVVTNGTGPSTTGTGVYTYVAAPVITSVTPATGGEPGGVTVALVGTGFTGATSVTFNGIPAESFSVTDATDITAVSPPDVAGVHDIVVTTVGGSSTISSSDHFTDEGTYTEPSSTDDSGTNYFMDVAINPATLASGELVKRFDPVQYPQEGVYGTPKVGA